MAIFAISDLHLSFGEDKPMDIFGEHWENHYEKIEKDWIKKVSQNDLVLLPGDFSWAMKLQNTYNDFKFIEKLPGKKLLLKGNHDYWWTTLKSMRKYLKENNLKTIDFLHNNSYEFENYHICGTRGWTISENDSENKKIYKREVERLKLSLESLKQFKEEKDIIVCMHYPPIKENETSKFVETMQEYNVKTCIYGHLHGASQKEVIEGKIKNIQFKMVSCDYTNFKLIQIG